MNGLEKILQKIADDNKSTCQNILDKAKADADKIINDAKIEGQKQAQKIIDDANKKAQLEESMAVSGADLAYKRKMLSAKLEIIDDVIKSTKDSLKNAGDAEYADTVTSLALYYAEDGEGEMKFSEKDLKKFGKKFEDKLNEKLPEGKKIKISDTPADIDGGFLLCYEDTIQNCTFDALIDDNADEIKDNLAEILFA
jgi:V/A-type H+-transporting ATPase subunit E